MAKDNELICKNLGKCQLLLYQKEVQKLIAESVITGFMFFSLKTGGNHSQQLLDVLFKWGGGGGSGHKTPNMPTV